jgi:hypothetical protein
MKETLMEWCLREREHDLIGDDEVAWELECHTRN